MHSNTEKRAKMVRDLVAEYYEPERQDRCKLWVYRHHVLPYYPMSERTFWRYLAMGSATTIDKGRVVLPSLFDNSF